MNGELQNPTPDALGETSADYGLVGSMMLALLLATIVGALVSGAVSAIRHSAEHHHHHH